MVEQAPAAPLADPGMAYEVEAIRYGSLTSTKSALYHAFGSYGEPDGDVELAFYFWLLRGPEGTILLDTGFDPAAGERRGRTCLIPPLDALRTLGVAPDSVSTVIVTHLHYDHVGNIAAFPTAQLVVPSRELEFWREPVARRAQFAHHVEPEALAAIDEADAEGRVRRTDGQQEILPGVRTITVGGHSPGQQIVLVHGVDGPMLLTSDALHLYEELELDRPFGIIADLAAMYRAYDLVHRLTSERGATLVPGHDPNVLARFAPGALGAELSAKIGRSPAEDR